MANSVCNIIWAYAYLLLGQKVNDLQNWTHINDKVHYVLDNSNKFDEAGYI